MHVPMMVLGAVVLLLAPATNAFAQAGQSPMTPRAAHERLAVFEGSWQPAGAQTSGGSINTCAWLEGGRRHMVCRDRRDLSTGPIEQRMTYGYRGRDSTYIATVFLASGQVWTYHGRPEGDKWVFDLQSDRPNNPQRLRMVITVARDTIHFIEESSESGGPWSVSEDYRHVRMPARGRDD